MDNEAIVELHTIEEEPSTDPAEVEKNPPKSVSLILLTKQPWIMFSSRALSLSTRTDIPCGQRNREALRYKIVNGG
jgi:hypothetical protein